MRAPAVVAQAANTLDEISGGRCGYSRPAEAVEVIHGLLRQDSVDVDGRFHTVHGGLAEDIFGATALTAATAPTIRRLADLEPRTLALMHGPAYAGDGRQALLDLADAYEARFATSIPQAVA